MRRDLADVHRLEAPAHRYRQHGPAPGRVEELVDEVVELGHPQQGDRQPRGEQHLLGGELRPVVAERDPVDADDGDVDEVPQPVPVHGLHQPAGACDVDLPRITARIAGGVHDDVRPGQRRRQVEAGGEVAPHPARPGAPPRHLPHDDAVLPEPWDQA